MYKNTVQRFNEIVKVLAFYGFGYIVDSKFNKEKNSPENLRKAFEELGPTFIKIGQILSTRPDILPTAYTAELSKLQDSVPPEKFEDINEVFSKEFNESLDDAFMYFDEHPLASASIAQVHEAITMDGKLVIVKIQRPEIREKMQLDISILLRIVRLTKAKFSDALIDPEEVLMELLDSTKLELNFEAEAENIEKFRELNKDVAFLYAPYVIKKYSSSRVITMERIVGFKITDTKKLAEGGYDLEDVGRKLILSFLKQIFEDSFFHADPHPGNIWIKDGKICYLDFGIMGNLSKTLNNALNDIIVATAYRDTDQMVSVLLSIGIKKGYINRNKLYEDIQYLMDSYLTTSLGNIKISTLLQEIFDTAKRNNIRLPRDFTLLVRSMIIIEGVVVKIIPDINILDIAIPYVKSRNRGNFLKKFNFDELLISASSFAKDSSRLPTKLIELSDSILSGRARLQFEVRNLDEPVSNLNRMVNRMVFGLVISSMIIGSSLILNTNIGPKFYNISIIGILGFGFAGIMGLWLLISILRSGKL